MLQKALVLCVMLLISGISCVDAFPLSGGNGIVNATVYGVTTESGSSYTNFHIDMSATHLGLSNGYLVELVDSEDRVHGTYEDGTNFGFGYRDADKRVVRNNNSIRGTLEFVVPKDAIIKRLKITPDDLDPFSIDWNGVPITSANGITMAFYSGQRMPSERQWIFDIKVTNTKNTTLSFSTEDFALRDNNGWIYIVDSLDSREMKLVPNESLRFPITFNDVGEFARPSEILFNNVTMDIGAWV
jgi:hypothetical protein